MKYKVGDRVKIKTWEELDPKYKIYYFMQNNSAKFVNKCIEKLNKNNFNRILLVEEVRENSYAMENFGGCWTDEMIECLAKDYKEQEPIYSRFEILDL